MRREPNKSKGVPGETAATSVARPMADLLAEVVPGFKRRSFHAELRRRKYLEAGLTRQIEIMAELAANAATETGRSEALLTAMAESDIEKITGLAARAAHLLHQDNPRVALKALKPIGTLPNTWARESAQVAIHLLAIQHGARAILRHARTWLTAGEEAVRRMIVEALRPRGVWVPHLTELRRDPALLEPMLAGVLDDESLYVRKAIANSLNDISKDHPETVCQWLQCWLAERTSDRRRWIAERALRTLIKAGHQRAGRILGLGDGADFRVRWRRRPPPRVAINELLELALSLRNRADRERTARVQLELTEPGAAGRPRRSRYLLGKLTLAAGATATVTKTLHFIDRNSRPRLAGTYHATVTVNGTPSVKAAFELRRP